MELALKSFSPSRTAFAVFATFKIDLVEGISENGTVDHGDLIPKQECGKDIDTLGVVYDRNCMENYYRRSALPSRSVIMRNTEGTESYLFSISRVGIKASNLLNMDETLSAVTIN